MLHHFTRALKNAGYTVSNGLANSYTRYVASEKAKSPKQSIMFTPPPIPELPMDAPTMALQASNADVAVITIGRNAGEGKDRKDVDDFYLSNAEQKMIADVSKAFHAVNKPVVVVMNVGGVTEISTWKDNADAILLAWQPGEEGGNAIADILSGKVNPSGKLTATFPLVYGDVPSAKTFPGKELPSDPNIPANPMMGRPAEITYDDGIYVGYRYYNTFGVKPAFEFGYGMSYTTFDYSNFKLSSKNFAGKVTASVLITNKGKFAGKEVVQLYISAPGKTMNKPESELKGFAKTRLLKPGEAQLLTFNISAEDLASFDTPTESWVAEAGDYKVKIGASSTDIRKTGKFDVNNSITVMKVHKALAPVMTVNEMTKN